MINLLRDAEARVGGGKTSRSDRKYTRAHHLGEIGNFNGWHEEKIDWQENGNADPAENGDRVPSDDDVVYLHEDLTVTQSMWHHEQVIFNRVTPEWKNFCTNVLEFRVPDDVEFCVPKLS